MAGVDDQLLQLLMQNLSGSPDRQTPLFPSSMGQAMTNLGQGLAQYGHETFQRSMGIPYQDPVAQALARAKLVEEIQQLQQKGVSRRAFPDQSKIFEPDVKVDYIKSGEEDEYGMENVIPFETRTFSPAKKKAAIDLYGRQLEDTDPTKRATFEQSAIWKKSLTDTAREKRRIEQGGLEERTRAAKEREQQAAFNARQRQQAAIQHIYDLGNKEEYPIEEIQKAASEAIDPETGEMDLNKVYKRFRPGQSPRVKRVKEEHDRHVKALEDHVKIARENAHRLAKQSGDSDGYRRFMADLSTYNAHLNAWKGDVRNMEKAFPYQPPVASKYIGLSFKATGAPAPAAAPTVKQLGPPPVGGAGLPDDVRRAIYGE